MNAEAPAKLEKLRAAAAANKQGAGSGKGVPRRVVKKVASKNAGAGDDKKLLAQFKKLNCQQISGIEVYTGAATVPPQFGGVDRRCGVIAVWTRDGY